MARNCGSMKNVAILYAESQFTPWQENINLNTVLNVNKSIPQEFNTSIIHMTEPNASLASLLKQFHWVFNMCYGFGRHSQADIAMWLDKNNITHLSSNGIAQYIAQDKVTVEKRLIEVGIDVPQSLESPLNLTHDFYISKPRLGGCHRDIEIVHQSEVTKNWQRWKLEGKIIQPYLLGREFSVAILPTEDGNEMTSLPPLEIIPTPARTVFIAGSSMGKTKRDFFPLLNDIELDNINNAAIKAHKTLNLQYMSRVDIRMIGNIPYVLDVNTMPNLHPTQSMFPALLRMHKIGMTNFIARLIRYHEINSTSLASNNQLHSEILMDVFA